MTTSQLLRVNPDLDRAGFAETFAATGRIQVPDVLTPESAASARDILEKRTP